jgi:uncharacterized protein YjbI with pentapeptide repeats
MRFRRVRSSVRRSLRGLQPLPAVCIAVTGGVAIVLLATLILDRLIHTNAKAADPIDITKLSFTVAGGVGAAVALVVAYRRQRDIEQGRFVERFGAAAAQLGDHDVAVRIAGVYAMAGVADESIGLRRQQCIDVLCGYLRLPYSPELGSNHQSKLVLTEGRSVAGARFGQQERHLEYRQNDKEVRMTIVRVIADHLRDHEYCWSACDFDFRTAHLEDVDFSFAVFGGTTHFGRATFSGSPASFTRATFSGDAWFGRATFSGPAWFSESTFSGMASFATATFSGAAGFYETMFRDAMFYGATFSDDAEFGRATFSRTAGFSRATFSGPASFEGATFSGRDSWFDTAIFSGPASFEEATFSGPVSFAGTDFGSSAISFEDPQQWGPPAPTFDWSGDVSTKPDNVRPQDWPPTPVA